MATTTSHAVEHLVYGHPARLSETAPIHVAPRSKMMLVARIALGAIFLMSGIAKLTDQSGTLAHMEQAGIPAPHLLLFVAAFGEIVGGLSLMTGFMARVGAIGLVVFLFLATIAFHNFWAQTGDEAKQNMIQFMKNLAIAGGLLAVSAAGPQRLSIDAKMRKPVEP